MGEVVTQFFALVGGADEGVGHELVVAGPAFHNRPHMGGLSPASRWRVQR